MLLIIIALFWVAVLANFTVGRLRDRGTERSIASFHAEHERLGRHQMVAPANRLKLESRETMVRRIDTPNGYTVVHADDQPLRRSTYRYARDEYAGYDEPTATPHRYAAYGSQPYYAQDYQPIAQREQRVPGDIRRRLFWRLALPTLFMTMLAIFFTSSLTVDLAVITWVPFLAFYVFAMYVVEQGWMPSNGLPIPVVRWPHVNFSDMRIGERASERLATIRNLHSAIDDEFEEYDQYDNEYYEEGQSWDRPGHRRRAVG